MTAIETREVFPAVESRNKRRRSPMAARTVVAMIPGATFGA